MFERTRLKKKMRNTEGDRTKNGFYKKRWKNEKIIIKQQQLQNEGESKKKVSPKKKRTEHKQKKQKRE